MSDEQFPPMALRAPGIRVEHRDGRLVVRSGPPSLLVAVFVAAFPSVVFIRLLSVGRWEAGAPRALLFFTVVAAAAWLFVGSWTVTLDRQQGLARLCRGPWPTRRPLPELVAVRFFSMRQVQIERVRRRRTLMPYAPIGDVGCGVALVDTEGRWWRVTRPYDSECRPRREDAEQAARLVAIYLGVPFLPPYETPPGGAVPPPLPDDGAPQPRHEERDRAGSE